LFSRLLLCAVALLLCVIAAALFDRFDPARGYRALRASPTPALPVIVSIPIAPPAPATKVSPLVTRAQSFRFTAVLAAELRLMLKGQRWWWYSVAAGLVLAQALVSKPDSRGMVLAFAWIWPILLWSSMGMRELRYQTHQILFAAPHPLARQLPAVWLAGVLLAVVTGSGFALRLLLEKNLPGLFAWAVGALFIPSAALCLGVWSSSSKPFEILYT